MRDGAASDGVVGEEGGVEVGEDVDVVSASGVMSWKDGVESQNAVGVAVLDPAESSLVDVGRVGRVSVTAGNNAAVYTSAVAVPHLKQHIRKRFTGIDVDDLDIEGQGDTRFAFCYIAANILARDIVWASVTSGMRMHELLQQR